MNCHVNQDICIKCGLCESLAPNFFKVDNIGKYNFILLEILDNNKIDEKSIHLI